MTLAHPDAPLSGIGVLVTRPVAQSVPFANALRALGAQPFVFPALAILPALDTESLRQAITQLDTFNLAIFISPSAASMGMAAIAPTTTWPTFLPVAAVGKGTAKTLQKLGIPQVLTPQQGADSEHLLALPELQNITGQKIAIFRGEKGRETLAQTLRSRGAAVSYVACYRRGLPANADPAPILAAMNAGQIHAVTAFSSETLDNLILLLGTAGETLLRTTPLFVPHPRIAEHAARSGFQRVILCDQLEGEIESGTTARLVEYFSHD